MMKDWRNISYLNQGTLIQKSVYAAISSCMVLDILNEFDPLLAGTFPIGIDIPASDLHRRSLC
ncbi:MAG: DUF4269 domain-containing protein [Bacteroidota bacterium]